MLMSIVNSVLCKSNHAYVWGDTIDIIRNADLSLINLECVIASTGTEWNKTFKLFESCIFCNRTPHFLGF